MNYPQTLDYLYNKLPMFSRMGSAAFKKDLTNIKLLCDALGNPQQKFKSIHVGGTNGKGSVSHMLAAVLHTAGYKTGLYTSPHLYDFRERIKIEGAMISEEFVIDFVKKTKPLIKKIEPSFFEITVAMAFEAFALQKVDVAIIEVGLGGRLDSTNIIFPVLSVITNIGWDHMNMLGNTLQEIAFEKAGIIKHRTPIVIGEALTETKPVFEKRASEVQAPVHFAEQLLNVKSYSLGEQFLQIEFESNERKQVHVKTDLPGIYQISNVRTVLTSLEILKTLGWQIEDDHIKQALLNTKSSTGLMGRWDIVQKNPLVVLDVAHNKNGIEKMMEHLLGINYHHLHVIIGMVKDKDVDEVLRLLPKSASYYFTNANIPRALPSEELMDKAALHNLRGKAFDDVNTAVITAMKHASSEDVIIVCGSIFLVAEVDRSIFPLTIDAKH